MNKLIVCNTAAKIGDPAMWNPRIETVLRDGAAAMSALRDGAIARWFTPAFSAAQPQQVKPMAVRDADFREQLGAIQAPLLVISGSEDAVTPPAGGLFIQQHVKGAEYAEFQAAHLSNVQASDAFSQRVLDFLLDRV